MLSLLRLRAAPAALALRRPLSSLSTLSSTTFRDASLRAYSTEAPAASGQKRKLMFYCSNCRREGHFKKDCKEPTVCVACGVEGHERKHCPNPDPARLEALKTAPIKCFRCGVEGHAIKDCPQPPKCFICGQPGHVRKDCPSRPAAAPKSTEATAAA